MLDTCQMTDKSILNEQYSDDTALKIRKSLHHKYSTCKQGFGEWLYSQHHFTNGNRIIEFGSGNGDLREPYIEDLIGKCDITLSDFSQGMFEILTNK